MSATVAPIREGIAPEIDAERELVAWAQHHLHEYFAAGHEPIAIAMVLIAPDEPGLTNRTVVWSPKNRSTGSRICATAAQLLQARGLDLIRGD